MLITKQVEGGKQKLFITRAFKQKKEIHVVNMICLAHSH